MFDEPVIEHVTLPCPRLPAAYDGLTVLHLSDLHVTHWTRRLALWRETLRPLRPDVVAITGDLGHRAWTWKSSATSLTRLLGDLHPPLGTFFILGNHDALRLGPVLAHQNGFCYLRNEVAFLTPPPRVDRVGGPAPAPGTRERTVPAAGQRLALVGLDQHRRIDTDIPRALRAVAPADFKLMLLHYPDLIHESAAAGVDVCLAGHTHGGQICWPDGHPILRQDVLPSAMCTGVHRVGQTWMVVNRGIGAAGLRVRLFCPAHAILLTLRRGALLPEIQTARAAS
jgi:predicted MPP superfamily phosphohydrolase